MLSICENEREDWKVNSSLMSLNWHERVHLSRFFSFFFVQSSHPQSSADVCVLTEKSPQTNPMLKMPKMEAATFWASFICQIWAQGQFYKHCPRVIGIISSISILIIISTLSVLTNTNKWQCENTSYTFFLAFAFLFSFLFLNGVNHTIHPHITATLYSAILHIRFHTWKNLKFLIEKNMKRQFPESLMKVHWSSIFWNSLCIWTV